MNYQFEIQKIDQVRLADMTERQGEGKAVRCAEPCPFLGAVCSWPSFDFKVIWIVYVHSTMYCIHKICLHSALMHRTALARDLKISQNDMQKEWFNSRQNLQC